MKILILEDNETRVRFFIERFGKHDLKITENAKVAIQYLDDHLFDYIFLDNDLGPGNGEGIDVAAHLQYNSNNPNNKAITIIHSCNVPAAWNIQNKIPHAVIAPFNTDIFFNLRLDI
jgi:CheY-like chemotaxis protein